MSSSTDMVNHPPHYNGHPSKIEAIEVAELLPYCLGNVWKYCFRAGGKWDELEDWRKALWYLSREYQHPEWMKNCFSPSPSMIVAISRDVDRVCHFEEDTKKRSVLRLIGHTAVTVDLNTRADRMSELRDLLMEIIDGLEQSGKSKT